MARWVTPKLDGPKLEPMVHRAQVAEALARAINGEEVAAVVPVITKLLLRGVEHKIGSAAHFISACELQSDQIAAIMKVWLWVGYACERTNEEIVPLCQCVSMRPREVSGAIFVEVPLTWGAQDPQRRLSAATSEKRAGRGRSNTLAVVTRFFLWELCALNITNAKSSNAIGK